MTRNQQLVAYQTIVRKEIIRFSRIWVQTILPPVVTTSLYFVIFGGLIGRQIHDMEGVRYMDFIVPGLIMMAVITNSYSNVVSSFYSAKFQRSVEEILVSPTPNWIILSGFVTGGVVRGLVVGAAVTVVSLFFSHLHVYDPWVSVSVVLLTSVLFSLGGFINSVFARNFDDISIVPTFVLTPLTYLGGVFYSVAMLPAFWRRISLGNPILYMINAFRYGFLGITDINIWLSYGIIMFFIVILTAISLHLLDTGYGMRS
ncbi:MAG: ABC transporter permease [Pseudomonadota bacterium]|nr:ABC transporter permease [Pseudomonadota bacterium]